MTTITAGTTVYDRDGREAEYIAPIPYGGPGWHEVYPLMTVGYGDDEDVVRGPISVWEGPIYTKPPLDKVNREVEAAQVKLDELISQQNLVAMEMRKQEEEGKALVERLKRYDALKHIDKILANEITHYAQNHRGTVEIVELWKTKSKYGPSLHGEYGQSLHEKMAFGSELRLLSLFGSYEGDLMWKLNEHRDGSGSWTEVVPCFSLDHAQEEATKLLVRIANEHVEAITSSADKTKAEQHADYRCNDLLQQASRLKVADRLPAWIKDRAAVYAAMAKAKNIETLKAALEKATADYQKAILG